MVILICENLTNPSQEELENIINEYGFIGDWTAETCYLIASMFAKETADENNFYKNSIGFWDKRSRRPSREPDHISYSRGKVSSKYWYTPKGVYRQSNHWGDEVASCSWYIKGDTHTYRRNSISVSNTLKTAFIKWSDLKPRGLVGRHYATGRYFLSGFTFD